jgi:hypothetical protein
MAKYLAPTVLAQLDECRKQIFALREAAYKLTGIDVLDNDTLSALSIYEIVRQYDQEYNINFARNGEDAMSIINKLIVLIEQKASRISRYKKTGLYKQAAFQFHAMGNLEYDRYIFATRDEATLALVRIYDIGDQVNCLQVQAHLLSERAAWEAKNVQMGKTQKRDVIVLPEALLHSFTATKSMIDGVEVVRA